MEERLGKIVDEGRIYDLDYIDNTCSSGIYDRYLFSEEATIKPAFGPP